MTKFWCLILIFSSINSIAQDTLGTVFPKKKVAETEVTIVGDTVLVRFIYEKQKKSEDFSEAAWYSNTGKIADTDVGTLKDHGILGIIKRSDSLLYYTVDSRENKLNVYKSAGLGTMQYHSSMQVEGSILSAFEKDKNFLVVTWDRKSAMVRLYNIRDEQITKTESIPIWPETNKLEDDDVTFIAPNDPITVYDAGMLLKFFLYDDTFCAVFDAPYFSTEIQQYGTYRTTVYRKNLVTGEEDTAMLITTEKFTFKSFLTGPNGHILYRLSSMDDHCEFEIHDMDNNKLIGRQVVNIVKGTPGISRHGRQALNRAEFLKKLSSRTYKKSSDLGITVDETLNGKIVSVGIASLTVNQEEMIMIMPFMPVTTLNGILLVASLIHNIRVRKEFASASYVFLEGTPETGFKLLEPETPNDFIKIRVDNYELAKNKDRQIDYSAHFGNAHYWISITSFVDSPRHFITKFSKHP